MSSIVSMRLSENQKPVKTVRDSNIELLRILAMCGVVLLHYNGYVGQALGQVTPNSWNHMLLLGGEGLFVCAVDLFVLITGYFSCTSQSRQPAKILKLILQVMVFNCGYYLYCNLPQHTVTLTGVLGSLIPANYFVTLYGVLYLVSPYINRALQGLDRKQLKRLLILAVLLFSVLPTLADTLEAFLGSTFMGINPVSAYGDDWGYTFVNFALMYLIGAYIRLADVRVKKRYTAVALMVYTVILALTGKYDTTSGIAWSYCNPLVIGQAATAFLLFRQIPLRSRVINELSKGAFTCFLFHTYLLVELHIAEAVHRSTLYLLAHVVLACVGIYLASWLVYKVYSFVSWPAAKLMDWLCEKLRLNYSVEKQPN